MWQAIQYVSSGFTLAAFVVAVIAWVYKSKSEERAKLIDLAKENERADLVRDALEFFHVETADLTKAQQYKLALEQIQARAQRFKIIAIVVCIIALMGTVIAAYAITRQTRPPQATTENSYSKEITKKVEGQLKDARLQLDAQSYSGAWKTVEDALATLPSSREAKELQVDIAMGWVREFRNAPQEVYDLISQKLIVCLKEAAPIAKGTRAADIHAHLGWANYLMSMDHPYEPEFKAALAADAANPFAHAMWGYVQIARLDKLAEGKEHFKSALKSKKEFDFVRRLQLDAWRTPQDLEHRLELIRVLDEMRKNNETCPADFRASLCSHIYSNPDAEFLQRCKTALPAADHLATFQWLIEGDNNNPITRDFILAQLTDAAGDHAQALAMYRVLLGSPTTFTDQVNEEIKRLTKGSGGQESETSALLKQAASGDPATRAKLIASLARANVDPSQAVSALVTWVKDPEKDVRAAACEALAQFGRAAVPAVIPLLSSGEPRDVMNAAGILGRIALEPKLVVPALVKALENPDADVRGKVVDALQNFGADSELAVPALISLLKKTIPAADQRQLVYVLGEIGPAAKDAVPQLTEIMKTGQDPDRIIKSMAAEALGKIGPAAASAVPALIAGLDLEEEDVRLPTNAAEALGKIGADAKAAIPALAEATKGEREHRENYAEPLGRIAEALANRGDTQSLSVLRKAMQTLEAANVEPKYISPICEAIDDLRDKTAKQ